MEDLPHSHGEGIDILIECVQVQQKDRLDHHIIHTVHIELDLSPAITMPQA